MGSGRAGCVNIQFFVLDASRQNFFVDFSLFELEGVVGTLSFMITC